MRSVKYFDSKTLKNNFFKNFHSSRKFPLVILKHYLVQIHRNEHLKSGSKISSCCFSCCRTNSLRVGERYFCHNLKWPISKSRFTFQSSFFQIVLLYFIWYVKVVDIGIFRSYWVEVTYKSHLNLFKKWKLLCLQIEEMQFHPKIFFS